MAEAFVYVWKNKNNNKRYIGVHKGTPDDGYVCSSKYMKEDYINQPEIFIRQIIAYGSFVDMLSFEKSLLKHVSAATNEKFYNKTNSAGVEFTDEVLDKIRRPRSKRWKLSKETKQKMKKPKSPFSLEHREKLRQAKLGRPGNGKGVPRPHLCGDNNPAKRIEVRQKISKKMLGNQNGKH